MTDTTNENNSEEKIYFYSNKTKNLREKFESRRGKTLYLRYPKKLPINKEELDALIKPLCSGIINIRRQRQKCSRSCLIDFDSIEDCNKGLKELRQVKINNKKLFVTHPRTDKEEYLNKIIEKSFRSVERKKALRKLKLKAKQSNPALTSSIFLKNVPLGTTLNDIKMLFPDAIDMKKLNSQQNSNTFCVQFPKPVTIASIKKRRNKLILKGKKVKFFILNSEITNKNEK